MPKEKSTGFPEQLPIGDAAYYEIRVRGYLEEHWTEWFEGMAKRATSMGYQYFEIPTGHDAMISAPRDLVAILLEIVIGRRSD